MIKTIASFLGGVPLAVVLFFVPGVGLAEWWEHNPNAPAIAQGHLLFWSWDFRPLAVQAAAERADYMTERQAFWTVDNALKGQNAAVLNVKRAADRWQAASLVAEADAVRSNARRSRDPSINRNSGSAGPQTPFCWRWGHEASDTRCGHVRPSLGLRDAAGARSRVGPDGLRPDAGSLRLPRPAGADLSGHRCGDQGRAEHLRAGEALRHRPPASHRAPQRRRGGELRVLEVGLTPTPSVLAISASMRARRLPSW